MTVSECWDRIEDLRQLRTIYGRLYYDTKSSFYKCDSLQTMTAKVSEELERLEGFYVRMELDDSYKERVNE